MKYRDLSLISVTNDWVCVQACDTSAAIGNKLHDLVQVSPQLTGQMATRVVLMELLCLGVKPQLINVLSGNEMEPTGALFNQGVMAELTRAGLTETEINGSTEENMETTMTCLGITALGLAQKHLLRMGKVQAGDWAFQIGLPLVGQDVVDRQEAMVTYQDLDWLERTLQDELHELVPIGSKGSLSEAFQVAEVNQKTFFIESHLSDLATQQIYQSSGPATSILVVGPALVEEKLLGHFQHCLKIGAFQ